MLPGDLLRKIKRAAREPGNVWVTMVDSGDYSDQHRAMLWYGAEEVCAIPCGEVPERSVYVYRCMGCNERHSFPFRCLAGQPPPGFESRAHLLAEPSNQGHIVICYLVRRGASDILSICAGWRNQYGQRMLRA
jgi:hypothetical protein